MEKTIYIIGAAGRTGAMFCRELRGTANIIGVGLQHEANLIREGKVMVQRGGAAPEVFKNKIVGAQDFSEAIGNNYPDYVWLAIRNPVKDAVASYYAAFRGKQNLPALVLSQNGLSAASDARDGLKLALGQDADRVAVIRVSLINAIDVEFKEEAPGQNSASRGGTATYKYKIPVKLGLGLSINSEAGRKATRELAETFRISGFKVQEFYGKGVSDMENSKLFTNLIGMAAAANGAAVDAGLRDKNIFKEETAMLKEFVIAVKASGGGFADNFAGYPIKLLAEAMLLPAPLLVPLRKMFAAIVSKGRNRPKDLSEIDYYNGEAVRLGRRFGVATPVNERITAKAKEILAG